MDMTEIKSLLDQQGQAFDAFKQTHEELKKADGITAEKLTKIEASLDAAVEAKAALEAKFTAEAKAREDLEAKLNRLQLGGMSEETAKGLVELKSFNTVLQPTPPTASARSRRSTARATAPTSRRSITTTARARKTSRRKR
jgi:hypothetical protein